MWAGPSWQAQVQLTLGQILDLNRGGKQVVLIRGIHWLKTKSLGILKFSMGNSSHNFFFSLNFFLCDFTHLYSMRSVHLLPINTPDDVLINYGVLKRRLINYNMSLFMSFRIGTWCLDPGWYVVVSPKTNDYVYDMFMGGRVQNNSHYMTVSTITYMLSTTPLFAKCNSKICFHLFMWFLSFYLDQIWVGPEFHSIPASSLKLQLE